MKGYNGWGPSLERGVWNPHIPVIPLGYGQCWSEKAGNKYVSDLSCPQPEHFGEVCTPLDSA